MNFGKVLKLFDTVTSILDLKTAQPEGEPQAPDRRGSASGFAEQLETHLTNVVVAALKEAFNRDQVRLDLERAHLEEQRRRAEETMRMEARRQRADREVARLRLLAGCALAGWIFSIVLLVAEFGRSISSRGLLLGGSVLCLVSLASAFIGQSKIGGAAADHDRPLETTAAAVALAVLVAGLALTTSSLLLE